MCSHIWTKWDVEKHHYFAFVLVYNPSMPNTSYFQHDVIFLFIPQRPYLPHGNLRFQALFLLEDQNNISDIDLSQLFRSVNLLYLLERHSLDTVSISHNRSYINRYNFFLRLLIGQWHFPWVSNSVYPSSAC